MSDVTRILSEIKSGDPSAAEHLLPLLYEELRKLRPEPALPIVMAISLGRSLLVNSDTDKSYPAGKIPQTISPVFATIQSDVARARQAGLRAPAPTTMTHLPERCIDNTDVNVAFRRCQCSFPPLCTSEDTNAYDSTKLPGLRKAINHTS